MNPKENLKRKITQLENSNKKRILEIIDEKTKIDEQFNSNLFDKFLNNSLLKDLKENDRVIVPVSTINNEIIANTELKTQFNNNKPIINIDGFDVKIIKLIKMKFSFDIKVKQPKYGEWLFDGIPIESNYWPRMAIENLNYSLKETYGCYPHVLSSNKFINFLNNEFKNYKTNIPPISQPDIITIKEDISFLILSLSKESLVNFNPNKKSIKEIEDQKNLIEEVEHLKNKNENRKLLKYPDIGDLKDKYKKMIYQEMKEIIISNLDRNTMSFNFTVECCPLCDQILQNGANFHSNCMCAPEISNGMIHFLSTLKRTKMMYKNIFNQIEQLDKLTSLKGDSFIFKKNKEDEFIDIEN